MDAIQTIEKLRKPRKKLDDKEFGELKVIRQVARPANVLSMSWTYWLCRCKCGQERIVASGRLNSGVIYACEECSKTLRRLANTTHGMSRTRVYRQWWGMKKRCENKNYHAYPDYGGAGITVFPEWSMSFEAFYAYMGDPPTDKHTLDRFPDQRGNYEPGNCRWATPTQQSRNMRSNVLIPYQGHQRTVPEWSEITGIPKGTLRARINKGPSLGWTIERAMTEPVRGNGGRFGKGSNRHGD